MQLLLDGSLTIWLLTGGVKVATPPEVVLFVEQFFFHFSTNGILLFTLHTSCGRRALVRSTVAAAVLALLPAGMWLKFKSWPFQAFSTATPWSQINMSFSAALAACYLAVLVFPDRWWHRRACSRTLAAAFLVVQALNLATCAANRSADLSRTEITLFGAYLLAQFALPLAVFVAAVQDSRFWSGQSAWKRQVSVLRIPLMSPLRYAAARYLSAAMDDMAGVVLNFAFLQVDTRAVLGQGSSSKVYQGAAPAFAFCSLMANCRHV